ncbi:hypothetical protein ACFL0V_03535 [Nanoarchaeota archaeon]
MNLVQTIRSRIHSQPDVILVDTKESLPQPSPYPLHLIRFYAASRQGTNDANGLQEIFNRLLLPDVEPWELRPFTEDDNALYFGFAKYKEERIGTVRLRGGYEMTLNDPELVRRIGDLNRVADKTVDIARGIVVSLFPNERYARSAYDKPHLDDLVSFASLESDTYR